MSNYRCNKTFQSSIGQKIYFGTKLSYKDYASLPYSEQNNFSLIRDEEKEMRYLPEDELFNANDLEVSKED